MKWFTRKKKRARCSKPGYGEGVVVTEKQTYHSARALQKVDAVRRKPTRKDTKTKLNYGFP